MRFILIALLFSISMNTAMATSDVWIPEARFNLEDLTLPQSMLWISGISYAVSAVGRGDIDRKFERPFCSPENGYIGSKELFEILNEKYAGVTITAEEATAEIMNELPKRFPC
jgi:hypothetical protein